MGFMSLSNCGVNDANQLFSADPQASVVRDICPFPNYNPRPVLANMLTFNSTLHLRNHYTAVQSSLTPKQLEDFTRSLRTTFGREGKVTLGGVGVVALSLAVLFDTLARQVRGEWVSESGPIPGLFVKDLRGYYPPQVYTISEYLRLVPHIANNPARMREETERNIKQLIIDYQSLDKLGRHQTLPMKDDTTAVNLNLGFLFAASVQLHLLRINGKNDGFAMHQRQEVDIELINFNFNCELDAEKRTWVEHALTEMSQVFILYFCEFVKTDVLIAQREDFDLKANALGKWAE